MLRFRSKESTEWSIMEEYPKEIDHKLTPVIAFKAILELWRRGYYVIWVPKWSWDSTVILFVHKYKHVLKHVCTHTHTHTHTHLHTDMPNTHIHTCIYIHRLCCLYRTINWVNYRSWSFCRMHIKWHTSIKLFFQSDWIALMLVNRRGEEVIVYILETLKCIVIYMNNNRRVHMWGGGC